MRRCLPLLIFVLTIGCSRGPAPGAAVSNNIAPEPSPEPGELKKLSPGSHQQTADVPGLGRIRYTIEVPEGYDGKTPTPLVLALHYGYEGATPPPYTGKGMIRAFRSGLASLNAIIVAPDALGGSWTDAQNEKAAVWLTKSAMKTYAIDPKKVIITGFSLGGEGAWFIGARHQDLFAGVVPVAAPVAGGDAVWKIPIYVIHSDKDDVVPYSDAKKHADLVKGKGAKLEFVTVAGLSHYMAGEYGAGLRDAVKWLQEQWK